MKTKTLWLIGILCVLSIAILLKGCNDSQSDVTSQPKDSEEQAVTLKFSEDSEIAAKAVGLLIEAVGVNEQHVPIGPSIEPLRIQNLVFPLSVQVRLFRQTCRYKITVTATLTRGGTIADDIILNICEGTDGEIVIDPYEQPMIGEIVIEAPGSIDAGNSVSVSCSIRQLNAPDSDRFPLSATLSEQSGNIVSGAIDEGTSITGSFPDPYPVELPSEEMRMFTCTIIDERSLSQTVERSIARILPTPTPTPTVTPTATPTPRFTDNGDGTITDNQTGLLWLKNANCFGELNWDDSVAAAAGLSSGDCGLTDGSVVGNWHLASRSELWGLVDINTSSPSLPVGHPFIDVQNDFYFTSTKDSEFVAWLMNMDNAQVTPGDTSMLQYVWPVR